MNSPYETFFQCKDNIKLKAYLQTMFVGVGYTVGFIVLSLVVRRNNRKFLIRRKILIFKFFNFKKSLDGTFAISGVCGLVLTFVYNEVAVIILFAMFALFSGLNVPLINGCAVDIFPTYLR